MATLLCESKPQLSSQNVDPNLIFVDSDVFVRDEITLGVNEEVRKQNKGTATIVSGRLTGRSQLIIPSRSTNSGTTQFKYLQQRTRFQFALVLFSNRKDQYTRA